MAVLTVSLDGTSTRSNTSNKGIEVLYTKWQPWLLVLTDKKVTAEFLSYLTNIKESPSTEEITTSQTAENIDEEIDQDDGEAKEETVGAGVDNQSTNQKKNEAKKPRKRAKGKGKKK